MAFADGGFRTVAAGARGVHKPAAITNQRSLDIDFSAGRAGAVADGKVAVSPPATAQRKPFQQLCSAGSGGEPGEFGCLFGSSWRLYSFFEIPTK
jgi:hypothetical protein